MNITSTSDTLPENRRFGFWGNLPLARKLLLAFGALFVFAVIIAIITLTGLNRTQVAYENTLAQGIEIRRLSDQLTIALLRARRDEKISIRVDRDDAVFITSFGLDLVDMRTQLKELARFGPVAATVSTGNMTQAQYEADIALLTQNIDIYEERFITLAKAYEKRGIYEERDFEYQFRVAANNIEANILGRVGLEPLVITYYRIRLSEKKYLDAINQLYLDQAQLYATEVHTHISLLKDQIAVTDQLDPAEKNELLTQADAYLTAFDARVELEKEITTLSAEMSNTAQVVDSLAKKFDRLGQQLAIDGISAAQANGAQTFTVSVIAVFVVLVLSVLLAFTLSRELTRPIIALTNTAQEISAGRFDIQAQVNSTDEIGRLAQTFNTMAAQLAQAFEDVRRRAAELATVTEVSTATSTILNVSNLLQEVVDLTKERFSLYHSHIYLLDEAGENLVLASGAGEAGRQMVAEKRSIPLNREQSLVARAAREQKGVTVNDVTQAPDFLPNVLLPDTRSELAVPMIVGGKVIGVFDVQSDVVGRFTDSDINIQTTLAAQVATSVQNVRSFEQSKTQADFESLVNTIGQKIQRATTVEDTLQTAIRELGGALGATRVKAMLGGHSNGGNKEGAF